jgi:hypothetical protein
MPTLKGINVRTMSLLRSLSAYSTRERQFLLSEMVQVKGLMPLLMKPRNKQRWTAEDKAELAVHLKRLSRLSPYLVVVVMPGGFFLLPVLAWWLDRRRNRNRNTPRSPS